MKDSTRWFLKILLEYTRKNTASITCVLKVVLIFRNILPCDPLKSIFLDSLTVVFLLLSIFLNNFFLLAFYE